MTTRNDTPITLLHIDEHLIATIKPGGLLSVPGRGPDRQDSMARRLQALFPDMIKQPAVHRLDMHTSGVMIFARTAAAHRELSRQFEQREVKKTYEAIVEGEITESEGIIRLSFRLDVDNRPRQIYDPVHGKPGITRWVKLNSTPQGSRIRFFPETGRTHQLRLHAAHPKGLGKPIIGDYLYGTGQDGDAMLLHATELRCIHPINKKRLHFSSAPSF